MLEIIPHGELFIIRRVRTIGISSFNEYWSARGWTMTISDARVFDTEAQAEECRVLG